MTIKKTALIKAVPTDAICMSCR